MTYIFKQSQQYLIFIVAMLALMLRGWAMLGPFEPVQRHNTYFSDQLLANLMSTHSQLFLALLLTVGQAILLNLLVKKYELVYRHTWMPSLCYILCCSLTPSCDYLSPQMMCNTFIILGLWRLLGLYKSEFANQHIFETGFLFGLCFVLRFEMIVLLPFLLIGINTLRVGNLREWAVLLSGYLLPVYLLVAMYYLNEQLPDAWQMVSANFYKNDFPVELFKNIRPWLASLVALFIFLMGCLKLQANYNKGMLKIRKFQTLLILMLPLLLLAAVLSYEDLQSGIIYMAAPSSVLMAYYFMGHEWAWWKEMLFWLLVGCILYPQLSFLG